MQDYATGLGAIVFILGILLVGVSGNRGNGGMRLRALVFSVGALLILAGTAAELAALYSASGQDQSVEG